MDQQIRFCTAADGVRLAYATAGQGYPLVKAANWMNHLEFDWESPIFGHLFTALAAHHTLIRYDERGTGLSDRDVERMSFEDWVSDLETVVDAGALDRFALLGISQGGPVAIAYAARHPERVSHLILYGTFARFRRRPQTKEETDEARALLLLVRQGWGKDNAAYRQIFTTMFIPNASAEQMRWFNDVERISASPDTAVSILATVTSVDVTAMAATLDVPTLILHCRDDQTIPFSAGRELAALVPGARFVPLKGSNHLFLEDEPARDVFLREVSAFLGTDMTEVATVARAGLRTVLFTDIVGHTEMMQRLGDAKGRDLLREHERITREMLKQHGGAEVKTMGDGFMASFGSVTSAVDCAIALQRAFAAHTDSMPEPLHVRVGLNAGEPIEEDGDLFGSTVILASRIAAKAGAGEILIPEPVRHLLSGKSFVFSDRGEFAMKGFDDAVRLYEVRWRE